MQEGSMNITH